MTAAAVVTTGLSSEPATREPSLAPAVSLVTGLSELPSIVDGWRVLRKSASVCSSNADPDRYAVTVAAMSGRSEPYCVLFREQGRPVAALIARRTRRPIPCRIGYLKLPSPRLDCLEVVYGGLLTDGTETARRALREHLAHLLSSAEVDHILVNHLPAEDPICTDLLAFPSAMSRSEPHWSVKLVPGSFEQTIGHHSSKHRSKLRRYDRILCEAFDGEVELREYSRPDQVQAFLESSQSIAERTYQAELGVAVTDTPLRRAVLELEARLGRFRGYVLFGRGAPIAYQNGAIYGDRYLCDGRGYLPEHSNLRPGSILSLRIMADLCRLGLSWIDYGFGDAEYKRIYATDQWQETTIRLYGSSARARISSLLDRLCTGGGRALSSLADSGVARRLKRGWRRRLAQPTPEKEAA